MGNSIVAQPNLIDSLSKRYPGTNDTLNLVICRQLNEAYNWKNWDSAIFYGTQYARLAKKLDYKINYADALRSLAISSATESAENLKRLFAAEKILTENTDGKLLPENYRRMLNLPNSVVDYNTYLSYTKGHLYAGFAGIYWSNRKYNLGHPYAHKALAIANELDAPVLKFWSYISIGLLATDRDSSLYYLNKCLEVSVANRIIKERGLVYDFIAKIYGFKKDYEKQLTNLQLSLQHYLGEDLSISIGWGYLGLGEFYMRSIPVRDSALYYLNRAYQTAVILKDTFIQYWSSKDLYELYKKSGSKDSAFKYADEMIVTGATVFNDEVLREFEDLDYREQVRREATEKAALSFRNKLRAYLLFGTIAVFLLLAMVFWRSNRKQKKAYHNLEIQKAKTEQALQELKTTQQQLLQSEKMASLGELTAGIAHEIQNPLNFVNNFSEINKELIEELKVERRKGPSEREGSIELQLLNDIEQNLEKISFHGRRADSIVKGMLQHSRTSSGQKEPTDINALVEEFLRLAYHGHRAKDKSFTARIEMDLDPGIGKIKIVPQEMGRVLLNLVNNSFYAMKEKQQQGQTTYEAVIKISSRLKNGTVELKIADNGTGIPQSILDKIFQPFFTTKPTGQGTGLGLSLAYDIITKGHGGNLSVTTTAGGGAVFTITLPHVV